MRKLCSEITFEARFTGVCGIERRKTRQVENLSRPRDVTVALASCITDVQVEGLKWSVSTRRGGSCYFNRTTPLE